MYKEPGFERLQEAFFYCLERIASDILERMLG